MTIRALLFDKDGTLVDFQRTWGPAAHAVMEHFANGDREAYRRLAEVSLYDPAARRFLPGSPVVIETTAAYGALWASALGREAGQGFIAEIDRLFFDLTLAHLAVIGDLASLLGDLAAAGYPLGLMTNDADRNTRAQLRQLGLEHRFRFVAAYDSGFGAKPDPAPVRAFAEAVEVALHEVAVIGDSVHDLDAARSAGAVAVAVLTGPTPGAELRPRADAVLPSIAALPEWLRTQANVST